MTLIADSALTACNSAAVALKINEMEMEGNPADIAAVMKALNG